MATKQAKVDNHIAAVSTVRFLLLVDLSTKQVWPIENHRPEYYGISWFPSSERLILSHSNIDNASLSTIADYAQSECGSLSQGDVATTGFLSQPHQILCAPDGRVVCTNTGRNSVVAVDLAAPSRNQEVRISSARWDRLATDHTCGDHLNSVFIKDGVLYVIAHGHTRGSSLVKFSYPGMELLSVEPVASRTGLHNIWVTDQGEKYSCHSESGAVIELEEKRAVWKSGAPVYTRGLAASEEYVLVGESERTRREMRPSSMSGLWLLDRQTWAPLDYYALGPYGAVHDVRLMNVPDQAHHGHPFAGLSSIFARNLQSRLADEKVKASRALQSGPVVWKGFETVFGAPTYSVPSSLKATPGNLCLLTAPSSAESTQWHMHVSYSLDLPSEESHFSFVRYRGVGCDTDMHAILIQPLNASYAHASLWVHNGISWSRQAGVEASGLPLRGTADFCAEEGSFELRIDQRAVIRIDSEMLPPAKGRFGVRFVGATLTLPVS